MKKFTLAAFALAIFVSNSWANDCSSGGHTYTFCGYGSGCFKLNTQYSDGVSGVCTQGACSCDQLIEGCLQDGGLYGGSSVPNVVADSPYGSGYQCDALGLTQIGGSSQCNSYCQWDTGCFAIAFPSADNPDATGCADLEANCAANSPGGQVFYNSTCSGGSGNNNQSTGDNGNSGNSGNSGNTPILISVPKVAGLTVVSNGNVLHILSAQDATISLFDIRGTKVLSGKASAGKNSTISLESQKQGIYYAVVQSGSHKQTLKVVLK